MQRYLRLFCVFVLGLLFSLSLFGCTSRVTVQELRQLNPDALVIDECVRMPIGRGRADIWALRRSTGQMVSDREPQRLRHFVKMADVIYYFTPDATRRNLAALPWPYQHMGCESQSSYSTQKLPAKLPELPISTGSRAALVSILTNECVAEPSPQLSVNKEFLGQVVGVPISATTRPQFTREHMDEVAQAMRDALRGEIHRLVTHGPLGEKSPIGKFRPTLVDDSGNVIDTPGGQLVGGFAGGVFEGAAPGGAVITQAMIDNGILPKGTREARLGKALGEIGVGAAQTFIGVDGAIIGSGLTLTGGGAAVGVPVCIGGVALATNGAITFCNGVKSLAIVLCRWEDEQPAAATSAPPTAATPAAPTPKPAAKPATSPPQPAAKPAAKPAPGQTPAQVSKRRGAGTKSGKNTTTWVKCTGQNHHAISRTVHDALERHQNLKGIYKYRDNRFVTQAIDKAAHNGYQKWHIAFDKEVANWIDANQAVSAKDFEAYLINRYAKSDLKVVFPNGF